MLNMIALWVCGLLWKHLPFFNNGKVEMRKWIEGGGGRGWYQQKKEKEWIKKGRNIEGIWEIKYLEAVSCEPGKYMWDRSQREI